MTPTNEAAERLNHRCQQTRISAGEIDPNGRNVTAGSYTIYVGDEIATRQNNRRLTTDRAEMVRNRAVWTVDTIHPDGSLTATGRHGTVRLPAGYVAEHVDLAYARTGNGGQGRNVNGGFLYLDRATDGRNLYVPMSRGTGTNEAFIVTTGEETALDVFTRCIATDWIDQPALARQAELNDTKPHRPGLLDGGELRPLLEQRHEITTAIEQAQRVLERAPREHGNSQRAKQDAEQDVARTMTSTREAQEVLARYDRPLHRRKQEAEIATAKRDIDQAPRVIAAAREKLHDAEQWIEQLHHSESNAAGLLERRRDLDVKVADIDDRLGDDLRVRVRIARPERPAGIVESLGARPEPGRAAQAWDLAAGHLHRHQAAFDITNGLGPRPHFFDETAYTESHALVADLITPLQQDVRRPHIEIAPPGIGL